MTLQYAPETAATAATLPPLLQALNPEQLAAVTLGPEPALILAGAGSGKTKVLTTRIAWLLSTGQLSPAGVLAVTFTNKAAKEMLTRLGALLPLNVRGMWIGTFHGLCHRMLRAHCKLLNLPATFQILDMQDQLSAIKRLHKQLALDEERFKPKELQWFINACKEEGQRAHQVPVRDADQRHKVEFYRLYEEQCQREGVLDFGELLLRSFELLRDHDPVREHYQRRFRHILVDEFQDTNRLQYAWLKLLAGRMEGSQFIPAGNAVLAVGDDDQSIYAFRGARVGNMADFVREFGVRQQIKLEQNYRSQAHILEAANRLIEHNQGRLGKNLRTDQGCGEPLRVYEAPSDYAEANWVVDEVRQLIGRDGLPAHEVALLYRSNAQSRVLETALFNAGLPYRVYGGLRFFERAEIKHALAYLRLIDNPHDDTSLLRVVNFPPRGIGARSIEALQAAAASAGCSLHDAVSAVPGKAGSHLAAFVALLDVLREGSLGAYGAWGAESENRPQRVQFLPDSQAHSPAMGQEGGEKWAAAAGLQPATPKPHRLLGQPLRQIVVLVLQHSGLLAHYRAERDGSERVENLEELLNAAESFVLQQGFGRDAVALPLDETAAAEARAAASDSGFEESSGETLSPLQAFLSHAALEAGDNQAQSGQDAVQLMTVHAAKGLEFDAVFITGLEEGLFPHDNSSASPQALEEERRLMYVAITRARQRLYLSHAQTRMLHGQTRYHPRSRFVDELPAQCLQWLSPKPGSGLGAAGLGKAAVGLQPAWGRSALVSEAPSRAAADATHGLRAGMQVFHPKFGQGQVLAVEGRGDDARAQVSFTRHGSKWLALAVAKLTPL
ncbi:UvrD-helicase domain-containing protein [Serpentinimonas maccroryi]|uniref:UvrD-helicase domain-containing protein n=1 Tax=Serpentinimonas maccroryi TaxID=1458426 RepID=UPI00203492EC|nr:UvrD-helicase domain-containing protein [Serpentinimonas maccroryi]MCM2478168.1 UvrD-helicase domain-containing protein [Serpentinimonas maccroryi]